MDAVQPDQPQICYAKTYAAEIVRSPSKQRESLVITQNGEAKVVAMDVERLVALEAPIHVIHVVRWEREEGRREEMRLSLEAGFQRH